MTVLTRSNSDDKSGGNGDDAAHSGELYPHRDKSRDKDHEGESSTSNGHKEE